MNVYAAIDLKSFYASCECRERNLDPLTTNLVVADPSRTEKTICLAVSPSLKQYGIPGRVRLFEVITKVREINAARRMKINRKAFTGKSFNDIELKNNKFLELDYIIAPPQMNKYMKYSTDIYGIYLKYFSEEDIYVYSIDEVFIDITHYLNTYKMRAKELITKVIKDIYDTTGITATAGIGTNLYLAKIAMDIVAKHEKADSNGVRIAAIDEKLYRKLLWDHKPLKDFWRVGKGYSEKLEKNGIYTMGDIARVSINDEDKLYKLFGINAELLIDHAWGYETCTIDSIKNYTPERNSLTSGQVLHCATDYKKTKLIVKEMAELIALDLVDKGLVTNQIVLTIGYDIDNLKGENSIKYTGEIKEDRYGRQIPKHAHGTFNLDHYTSSNKLIEKGTMELLDRIINKDLLCRRVNLCVNNTLPENEAKEKSFEQFDLFTDYTKKAREEENEKKEHELQQSIINIKKKFGKNAILKGMNLVEGGTTIERNSQVGGHKG